MVRQDGESQACRVCLASKSSPFTSVLMLSYISLSYTAQGTPMS